MKISIKVHTCHWKYVLTRRTDRDINYIVCASLHCQTVYIHQVFSALHPMITQLTRVPIDEQIKQVMGCSTFELCDNS